MRAYFKKKWLRVLVLHCVIVAIVVLLIFYGCVFYNLFGIICPACGATRAWIAFFRSDIRKALYFNAFFLIIPIYIFLFIHRDTVILKKVRFLIDAFLFVVTLLLLAFNIYRVCFNQSDIFPKGYI